VPLIAPGNRSVYAQYTIRVDKRAELQARLQQAGIPTAVHYPLPLHRQPAVADPQACLPVSELAASQVISLPMHPYLTADEQRAVVRGITR
jgi:UDP-2-acetamido-2-deoxy-ribo-hexuluronate aminotransferase